MDTLALQCCRDTCMQRLPALTTESLLECCRKFVSTLLHVMLQHTCQDLKDGNGTAVDVVKVVSGHYCFACLCQVCPAFMRCWWQLSVRISARKALTVCLVIVGRTSCWYPAAPLCSRAGLVAVAVSGALVA